MDFETVKNYQRKFTSSFFAEKFPGFYNDECYEILANYFNNEAKNVKNKNNKRKLEDLESDSGVEESKENVTPSEFFSTKCQYTTDIQGEIQG